METLVQGFERQLAELEAERQGLSAPFRARVAAAFPELDARGVARLALRHPAIEAEVKRINQRRTVLCVKLEAARADARRR